MIRPPASRDQRVMKMSLARKPAVKDAIWGGYEYGEFITRDFNDSNSINIHKSQKVKQWRDNQLDSGRGSPDDTKKIN